MFFINASELGEEFFKYSPEAHPVDVVCGLDEYSLSQEDIPENQRLAGRWIVDTVVPLFNSSNPHRELCINGNSQLYTQKRSANNRDVHRDRTIRDGRTYINLVLNTEAPGTSGTIAPKFEPYKYLKIKTDQFSDEELEKWFYIPPQNYASVFDPDTEHHAGQAKKAIVYKAEFNLHLPEIPAPIICPDDERCIDPLKWAV